MTDHQKFVDHDGVHHLAQDLEKADLHELEDLFWAYYPDATSWTEFKNANPELYADIQKIGKFLVRNARLKPSEVDG